MSGKDEDRKLDARPAAMALNRIPHGTHKVEKLLIMLNTAALLLQYANPARGFLKKAAVLADAMTWLLR
jgi:hypothetical protein